MDKNRFTELIDAYLNGKASDADKALLEAYYQKLADEPTPMIPKDREKDLAKSMYERICTQADGIPPLAKRNTPWRKLATIAAVLLVCCTAAVLWYAQRSSETVGKMTGAKHLPKEEPIIQPGGNKASLRVVGGEEIDLREGEEGLAIGRQGLQYFDGDTLAAGNRMKPEAAALLEARTPRGGTYQFVLPDGTRVSLNSETVLRFPWSFDQSKRVVELLHGEAYFEVQKDALHPFVVKTDEQEIEVLGTHFNVSHYADEPATKTTLAEGKVLVRDGHSKAVLRPGEQAIQDARGLRVKKVDIATALAWKNGMFITEGQDFKSTMQAIARWYDVEVFFENDAAFQNLYMSMHIARTRTLQEVLNRLESTGEVKFKTRGRRIWVIR